MPESLSAHEVASVSKWEALKAPVFWAPLLAIGLYVVAAAFCSEIGVLTYASRVGSTEGLPAATIAAWANLLGLLTLAGVSLGSILTAWAEMRGRDWLLVGALFLVPLVVGAAIAFVLQAKTDLAIDPLREAVLGHPVGLASAVLVAPLAEEIWGRGLVYGWLRRFGPWVAILGTALVTSGLHLDLARIAAVFPGMLALTWVRHHTGRLAPCVALHALSNAALVGLALLARAVVGQ
jgi:membrane protease YdiL (CAAX protease family)